jgi:hypothetical protein
MKTEFSDGSQNLKWAYEYHLRFSCGRFLSLKHHTRYDIYYLHQTRQSILKSRKLALNGMFYIPTTHPVFPNPQLHWMAQQY